MKNVVAVDLGQGVEDAFADVASFVPRLLGFLLVLAIGYFVAKAVARIADSVLDRVGFDRAVERGGIKKALSKSRYDASDILAKVIFYALFLLVLQLAFGVFGPNPVSELIAGIIAYLPRVIVAIIIVVVASAIAAAAKGLIRDALGGLGYGAALANIAGGAIVAVGVFAALNQLQIAPEVVNGLFYALLAVVAGSAIVAIGGGGIQPMRSRWEQALTRVEQEAPQARQEMQARQQRQHAHPSSTPAPAPEDSIPHTQQVERPEQPEREQPEQPQWTSQSEEAEDDNEAKLPRGADPVVEPHPLPAGDDAEPAAAHPRVSPRTRRPGGRRQPLRVPDGARSTNGR